MPKELGFMLESKILSKFENLFTKRKDHKVSSVNKICPKELITFGKNFWVSFFFTIKF